MITVELAVGQVVVGVSLGGDKESFSGRTAAYYPLNDGALHNVTLVMDGHSEVRGAWSLYSKYSHAHTHVNSMCTCIVPCAFTVHVHVD